MPQLFGHYGQPLKGRDMVQVAAPSHSKQAGREAAQTHTREVPVKTLLQRPYQAAKVLSPHQQSHATNCYKYYVTTVTNYHSFTSHIANNLNL